MIVTDKVLDCFENVAAAKGTNAKKELLKTYLNHHPFQRLIKYTFDQYQYFHVVKDPKEKLLKGYPLYFPFLLIKKLLLNTPALKNW